MPARKSNPTRRPTAELQEELQELRVADQIREHMEGIVAHMASIKADVGDIRSDVGALKPTIERIEEQTIKTNGRVTALEMWRARSAGTIAAIGAGVAVLGWLLNWAKDLFQR